MIVNKILGNVATQQGNQVIAELMNGHYAVGDLSEGSDVPEHEQFKEFEQAFYKWYDIIYDDL